MKISRDSIGVNGKWQLERAAERSVPALHTVILLAYRLALGPNTRQRQPAVEHVDVQMLALEAGQLRGEDVLIGRLVQIDRRHPSRRPGRKAVEPLLDSKKVPNGVPTRERHRSMLAQPCSSYARIDRIY